MVSNRQFPKTETKSLFQGDRKELEAEPEVQVVHQAGRFLDDDAEAEDGTAGIRRRISIPVGKSVGG